MAQRRNKWRNAFVKPSDVIQPKPPGLIIAASASGTGKTLITSGLIATLKRRGLRVGVAKVGPDYIDPGYHSNAAGRLCVTLDAWAMRDDTLNAAISVAEQDADVVICEGVMGLFDGAPGGIGSTADIAKRTGWPVLFVHAPQGQAASAAAVVKGFAAADPDVHIAGVIFNKVASERHWALIAEACKTYASDVPIMGYVPRTSDISVPSRHLGLVQASESDDLKALFTDAADALEQALNIDDILACARPRVPSCALSHVSVPIAPLGQRIAVASDHAFAFAYQHVLQGWRYAGAEISPFSPLKDEAPAADCDAIYIPGGYPELFAGQLAANKTFLGGLRQATDHGVVIFGECGGYMVLGDALTDADGVRHTMAGLLPVETSFASRKMHLGYRQMKTATDSVLGVAGMAFRGHEFHYATIVTEASANPLFVCQDAHGTDLGPTGLVRGSVAGSFLHLIDRQ